jgi:hypothetical protein
VVTIEKKLKIMIRFVLRRAKEVNNRLFDLEEIANQHSKGMSSLGRSMKLISTLFKIMGSRIDKLCEDFKGDRGHSAKMFDDIRKIEGDVRHAMKVRNNHSAQIMAIENDMNDNSTDCAAMWERLRLSESLIDKLQNKVDALEKLHTTKISAFIYGPTDPDIVQLQNKVSDLEKLHSTQIDGAALTEYPPIMPDPGEVEKF